VKTFVTLFCCAAGLVFSLTPASAEVLRLKNGDAIYADQVKEDGKTITYEIGDNTYTIPKTLIQTIEKTPDTGRADVAASAVQLPGYVPAAPSENEKHGLEQIISNGQVDRSALLAIESQGNSAQTAVAYYVAGRQEYIAGKFSESKRDFESALRNDSANPAILTFYAALLIKTSDAREALSYADRAVTLAPDSPDAFAVLGYAQFALDRQKDAVRSWKRSLALRPDVSIERLLARAEREATAESDFAQRETGHFMLSYEGRQTTDAFRTQILSVLESHYFELARAFGTEPRGSIRVVLYTNQAFFDVTQAPSWTAALNDGKLRIPIQGLETITPDLSRILKHELAHSFVNQLSMGRCPSWLNEGIAQMLEPRSLGNRGRRLAELFKLEHEIPLNMLEKGFIGFGNDEALLAYDESLASTEYLQASYGMSDVLRILEKLGQGESVESALRSTIHCDYRQLQAEVGEALARQFGS
jgi:tetratricopeptide (TPR) repeat protein